jgi:dTDP-glucose 4,6-dehydratase/UDP-glucuronate decarboxylase
MWLVLLSDRNGEVFNVGNDQEEVTINKVAEVIQEVSASPKLQIERRISSDVDYLTDNPQRRCPDLQKLRSSFSWKPEVPLAEGLRRTLNSYQERLKCS